MFLRVLSCSCRVVTFGGLRFLMLKLKKGDLMLVRRLIPQGFRVSGVHWLIITRGLL